MNRRGFLRLAPAAALAPFVPAAAPTGQAKAAQYGTALRAGVLTPSEVRYALFRRGSDAFETGLGILSDDGRTLTPISRHEIDGAPGLSPMPRPATPALHDGVVSGSGDTRFARAVCPSAASGRGASPSNAPGDGGARLNGPYTACRIAGVRTPFQSFPDACSPAASAKAGRTPGVSPEPQPGRTLSPGRPVDLGGAEFFESKSDDTAAAARPRRVVVGSLDALHGHHHAGASFREAVQLVQERGNVVQRCH